MMVSQPLMAVLASASRFRCVSRSSLERRCSRTSAVQPPTLSASDSTEQVTPRSSVLEPSAARRDCYARRGRSSTSATSDPRAMHYAKVMRISASDPAGSWSERLDSTKLICFSRKQGCRTFRCFHLTAQSRAIVKKRDHRANRGTARDTVWSHLCSAP